jgi:hypothetical protein
VAAGPLTGGKICRRLPDDEGRHPDGPPARVLGGPAISLPLTREDLGHGDRPGLQIDPAWAEPGQLPDPQAAEGATNTSAR